MFRSLLSLALGAAPALAVSALDSVTIFDPPSDYTDPGTLYARTVELSNGNLLATWENYSPEPPAVSFPIYQSTDGGATWAELSRVEDTEYGYGLRYQPFLYVLPEAVGDFAAGTLLCAGSAIPTDLSSTHLELYASADEGASWTFVSHVADGGEALPNNGLTPVWEPFLLARDGQLLYYYSDQRDTAHGQKLVHQASADLRSWGDVVTDVAYDAYTDRPGMPTLARLPNGQYIYAYEYGSGPEDDYGFPVHYRLAADPADVAGAPDFALVSGDGAVPNGSPYVVWSSAGGDNGTIVVSSGCCSQVYINQALGHEDAWVTVETPEATSYTRSLMVFEEDPNFLLLAGGGALPPSDTNVVSISVMEIS
ncbi:Sialidase [Xylariomycetidae sp. FL0641]|nr:Sialidase [Xylariomycetidae sp. FL0641]